jgi:hypothetical protein
MVKLLTFMINDQIVESPDNWTWENVVLGTTLDNREKRSAYKRLTWMKRVSSTRQPDWFDYDNETLTSLTAPTPSASNEVERYTDAILLSVRTRYRHGVPETVEAVFMVNTEA